jgi:anti-sigma factor RsiW
VSRTADMLFSFMDRRRELACREAVEMVNDYLEGTLTAPDRRRFEAHLAKCPHCAVFLEQMQTTVGLTQRLGTDDLSIELQDEFIEIFRSWKAEEQKP